MSAYLSAIYPLLTGDTREPAQISDRLPPIILERWTQALRDNTRPNWRQVAELCGHTAMGIFRENGFNPNDRDFKAICQLARVAHLRGVACLTQPYRECGALA